MPDITTEEFLDAIFENVPEGELVCLTRKEPPSRPGGKDWWSNHRAGSRTVRQGIERGQPWYFCVSTVKEPDEGEKIRRQKATLGAAYCVILDDIGTKVDAAPIAPSWRLETSADNFQWGYLLEPEERLDRVAAVVNALIRAEYSDPGAKGAYRVARVPGSLHSTGFRARVVEWAPERVWSLDELMIAFGIEEGDLEIVPSRAPVAAGGVVVCDDPVEAWLRARGMVLDDLNDRGYLPIRCPWAEMHTDRAAEEAGYSPLGVAAAQGGLLHQRIYTCFHSHGHNTGDFLEWVAGEGGPSAPQFDASILLPRLQERFWIVASGPRVLDLHRRGEDCQFYKENEFKRRFPELTEQVGGVQLVTAFMNDYATVRVRSDVYRPDRADELTIDIVDETFVNTYRRPAHERTGAPPERFLAHVAYLLPDEGERAAFLDWLAFKVQHPGRRCWAVVMIASGEQGIGRTWLGDFCELVLGEGATRTVSMDELTGQGGSAQFNEWQSRSQIVVVNEARNVGDDKNLYRVYEHLKELIDVRPVRRLINVKRGDKRQELVFFNLLIFSNHADAIKIDKDDRRFAVFTNPEERAPTAHYDAIHADMEAEAGRAYWWLMDRTIETFDAVYAPQTHAKEVLIQTSMSARDEVEALIIRQAHAQVFTKPSLRALVAEALTELDQTVSVEEENTICNYLWKTLKRLQDGVNGRRVRIDGRQFEVRALRNPERWTAAGARILLHETEKTGFTHKTRGRHTT